MFELKKNGRYGAYLRKSRMDIEAESRGEEDTYTRHMRTLMDLSKRHGISITHIYREKPATSGERITERPEMLKLLEDVEDEKWDGILVVEVERLARGDTMDQGIVSQAFKYSNTLIITPMRIYDPQNPDDEEYFEFGLFMSRREFKTITRRLQGGRVTSIKEGRFVGNRPPYGYNRVKLPGKGYTLEPHPDQAPIVKLIFSMYTDPDPEKRKGMGLIAKYLNGRNIPTQKGGKWTIPTLNTMIRNPTYAGYVRWGSRPLVKKRHSQSRPRRKEGEYTLVEGMHTPLIDRDVYEKAQRIMHSHGNPPVPHGRIRNPFAGLIRCDMCGGAITLRPYKKNPDALICPNPDCSNVSTYLHIVEDRLLQSLRDWIRQYKAEWEQNQPQDNRDDLTSLEAKESVMKSLRKQLDELQRQKNNLHDLVERQVYTIDQYLERSQNVAQRIEETMQSLEEAEQEYESERKRIAARVDIIPTVENVLDVYKDQDDPADKNALLKSVLEKVVYRKDEGGRWSGKTDQFTLRLYPKLSDH